MEQVTLPDGRAADVYYARTENYPDDQVTDDELTPYVFADGKLDSIGWDALGGPKTHYDEERVAAYWRKQMAKRGIVMRQQPLPDDGTKALQHQMQSQAAAVQAYRQSSEQNQAQWHNQMMMQTIRTNNAQTHSPMPSPAFRPGGFGR
jgi:hypothetical protein